MLNLPPTLALLGFLVSLMLTVDAGVPKIKVISLRPPEELTRADVYSLKLVSKPRAVLVLCPGCNDNGEWMLHAPEWQKYAKEKKLGLVALSFASKMEILADWRGYHIASRGSGLALLKAVDQEYGKDIPILLYGFSSGGLFIIQFASSYPKRVMGWCAYASGEPGIAYPPNADPPGVISCGELDAQRYSSMAAYFKQGRSLGKRLLWISLSATGHSISPGLEDFTRNYFAALLCGDTSNAIWVDVDLGTTAAPSGTPSVLSAWLPSRGLAAQWAKLHHP